MGSIHDRGLTAQQEQAIAALLSEPTVIKAAQAVGVSERTLYRWLDDPAFGGEFRRVRRESFTHSVSMAQKYAPVMLNTLASIAMDKGSPPSARVSASKAVLDFGRESLELDDVMQRMAKIEADLTQHEQATRAGS